MRLIMTTFTPKKLLLTSALSCLLITSIFASEAGAAGPADVRLDEAAPAAVRGAPPAAEDLGCWACCPGLRAWFTRAAEVAEDAGEWARTAGHVAGGVLAQMDAFTAALPEGTLSPDAAARLAQARAAVVRVQEGAGVIAGEAASTQDALDQIRDARSAFAGVRSAADFAARHVDEKTEAGAALRLARTLADTGEKSGVLKKSLPAAVEALRGDHPRGAAPAGGGGVGGADIA